MAADVSSYLAWKSGGSPVETPVSSGGGEERLEQLESAIGVVLARDWYKSTSAQSSPLISVVLPTRQRPALLRRAVESVLDQTYANWELLVVNDAPRSVRPPWSSEVEDGRVLWLETGGKGVGSARNLGLDSAQGEIVAFLDDDNVMDRDWLKTIVVAFEATPTSRALIGAQLVFAEPGSSEAPRLRYPSAFDWDTLARYNYIDLGMLAHKTRPDLRFDEALPAFLDWDYLVRLTVAEPPLLVPAISGIYFTDAPNRISHQQRRALQGELQRRFASLRPTAAGEQTTSGLSDDDLTALEVMIQRLASGSTGRFDILETGSPRASSALSAKASALDLHWERGGADNATTPGRRYDLVFLDESTEPAVGERLKPDGIVVGLDAHLVPYQDRHPGLRHQRRVGDALWVGSIDRSDLEALFPGAALTKLGYDHPPEGAARAGLGD